MSVKTWLRWIVYLTIVLGACLAGLWLSVFYWLPSVASYYALEYGIKNLRIEADPPTLTEWMVGALEMTLPGGQQLAFTGVLATWSCCKVTPKAIDVSIQKMSLINPVDISTESEPTANPDYRSTISQLLQSLDLPFWLHQLSVNSLVADYNNTAIAGQFNYLNNKDKKESSFAGILKSATGEAPVRASLSAGIQSEYRLDLTVAADSVTLFGTLDSAKKWRISGDVKLNPLRAMNTATDLFPSLVKVLELNDDLASLEPILNIKANISSVVPDTILQNPMHQSWEAALDAHSIVELTSKIYGHAVLSGQSSLSLHHLNAVTKGELSVSPWLVKLSDLNEKYQFLPDQWIFTSPQKIACELGDSFRGCLDQLVLMLDVEAKNSLDKVTSRTMLDRAGGRFVIDFGARKASAMLDFNLLSQRDDFPGKLSVKTRSEVEDNVKGWSITSAETVLKMADFTKAPIALKSLEAVFSNTKVQIPHDNAQKWQLASSIRSTFSVMHKPDIVTKSSIEQAFSGVEKVSLQTVIALTPERLSIKSAEADLLGAKINFNGYVILPESQKRGTGKVADKLPVQSSKSNRGEMVYEFQTVRVPGKLEAWVETLLRKTLGADELNLSPGSVHTTGSVNWRYDGKRLWYNGVVDGNAKTWGLTVDSRAMRGLDVLFALQFDEKKLSTLTPIELKLANIHTGIPIANTEFLLSGAMQFEKELACQVSILKAKTRIFKGVVRLAKPAAFNCDFSKSDSFAETLFIELVGLDLGQLIQLENKKIIADGKIAGMIPLTVTKDSMTVSKGQVAAMGSGWIKLVEAHDWKSLAAGNEQLLFAFDALENFKYNALTSDVNYSQKGLLSLGVSLRGANPNVRNGQEIHYNLNIESNILSLLKSLEFAEDISKNLQDKYK